MLPGTATVVSLIILDVWEKHLERPLLLLQHVLQAGVGQLGFVSGSRQLLFQVPDARFRLIPQCRHRIERALTSA
jgi:hypothetical protein